MFFVRFFRQRLLDNPRADSRQILHAGVLCMVQDVSSPLLGFSGSWRGSEKGGNVEYEWRACVSSTDALVMF